MRRDSPNIMQKKERKEKGKKARKNMSYIEVKFVYKQVKKSVCV
jgi:hypothetical protein